MGFQKDSRELIQGVYHQHQNLSLRGLHYEEIQGRWNQCPNLTSAMPFYDVHVTMKSLS